MDEEMMATSKRIPNGCGGRSQSGRLVCGHFPYRPQRGRLQRSRSQSGCYTFLLCASLWLVAFSVSAEELQTPTLQLAVELAEQGDHHGAAVEFRRLALESSDVRKQGAYYWASAYEYWKNKDFDAADKMLNRTEDAAPALRSEALLLRIERELSMRSWETAAFYSQILLDSSTTNDLKSLVARKLAAAKLRQNNITDAREALSKSPANVDKEMAAINAYAASRDKSLKVGGLLGLIPGFGYFYSGEYANGFRSIILNTLFIYGMVDTADNEQWGVFAVITFFEFTWYSGSIYGGIDAAHRDNRARLDSAVGAIHGEAEFEPDFAKLPIIALRFRF